MNLLLLFLLLGINTKAQKSQLNNKVLKAEKLEFSNNDVKIKILKKVYLEINDSLIKLKVFNDDTITVQKFIIYHINLSKGINENSFIESILTKYFDIDKVDPEESKAKIMIVKNKNNYHIKIETDDDDDKLLSIVMKE